MKEHPPLHQEKGFENREFLGGNISLAVWKKDDEDEICRIELVHDLLNDPHGLIFEDGQSIRYFATTPTDEKPGRYPAHVYIPNGAIPKDLIIKEFNQESNGIPEEISSLVISKLEAL